MNIRVTTQAELDKLPDSFKDYTVIEIDCGATWIAVTKKYQGAHVEARGSSHVVARGSSHVEAWESSHVVAWGSSHVEAWGSSHVVARGSSHVVARESVSVHVKSEHSIIELFGFAVAILVAKCKQVKKKSRTSTVVNVKLAKGNVGWLDREGVVDDRNRVTIFKRVSKDFKTQENTSNETTWTIGSTLIHQDWQPKSGECGSGKFHACSRPYFCDEFRSIVGDKYVAVSVAKKDLYAWDGGYYPHKVGFKSGKVLFECDRYGKKL